MLEKTQTFSKSLLVEIQTFKVLLVGTQKWGSVLGHWKEGDPCYKITENLAEFCCSVLWKVEFVSDEIGCLLEEVSEQQVEGVAWVLLVT